MGTDAPNDLGDVALVVPDSPTRWSRFSDDELANEWVRWRGLSALNAVYERECEGILREQGRRGGPRWTEALARSFAELSAVEAHGRWHSLALPALRALRLAQGKPDPLRLHVELPAAGVLECRELPMLCAALVNADAEQALPLTSGGSYRSGRFARIHVEVWRGAVGDHGRALAPREWSAGFGGGMAAITVLHPGERIGLEVVLGDYVPELRSSEYWMRLHYHDSEDIADVDAIGAWMTVASEPIRLVVQR